MSNFVLQPCKIRTNKIVPQKGMEPVEMDWASLKKTLAPSGTFKAVKNLRGLEKNIYVGTATHPRTGVETNFLFRNHDRSDNSFGWVLQKDPTLEDRIVKLYKVESVKWEGGVDETQPPKRKN